MTTIERASTGFSSFPHKCQPGTARLQAYVSSLFSLPAWGCLGEGSQLTSGAWSWHKYGKAIDTGANWYDDNQQRRGNALFDWAVQNREALNLQQAIFGNRIYDIEYGERIYHRNDHTNHVHIAIGYHPSQNWTPPGGPYPPTTPGDYELTEAEFQRLVGTLQTSIRSEVNRAIEDHNRIIGTQQNNMKDEFIPSIVKKTVAGVKALPAKPHS